MKKSAWPGVGTARKDDLNVLPLEGDIDLRVSPAVTTSLNEMIAEKPTQLVVDLSRVTYIDSSGVAAFISAMQTVEAYGGKFALAGLQETVRLIFEISSIDQVFSIFPDVDSVLSGAAERGIRKEIEAEAKARKDRSWLSAGITRWSATARSESIE